MNAGPVVVTDLDGTLWGLDHRVGPRTRAAIAALLGAGVPVLAATARRIRGARAILAANDLALPVVGLNGSIGEHPNGGARFHDAPFAPDMARAALEALLRHGLAPCVYVDEPDVDVVLPAAPSTNPGHVASLAGVSRTADLARTVAGQPVYSFSVLGRPQEDLRPAVAELDAAGVVVDFAPEPFWPGWSINVVPPGVSKWSGVLAFCAATGHDPGQVLAAGDGSNDVPMLLAAARPVVVEASRAARFVDAPDTIAPPECDGWAAIAELLGVPVP